MEFCSQLTCPQLRTFDANQFQQPRFGTPSIQSPFSSIDRGIPYQSASSVSTVQINRPFGGPYHSHTSSNGSIGNGVIGGNGHGMTISNMNNQAAPRSPRSHSRTSSYSTQSSQNSRNSPPTPQFGGFGGPPQVPSTPISFHPLIRVLEKFRAQGLFQPLRSAVGSELRQSDPHVYDKLGGGIRTFKEYAGAAERSGLVALIGGSPGKEKISLVK